MFINQLIPIHIFDGLLRYLRKKAGAVVTYLLEAFAVVGVPKTMKTDAVPPYTSAKVHEFFLCLWYQSYFGNPL